MLIENFKDWACSLSGCDGGNINADTWLCGIEWGAPGRDAGIYYDQLLDEIKRGKATPPVDGFDWKGSIKYSFGRSFAKLFAAIQGEENVQAYRDLVENKWDGSELFKLNLYPIPFNSTDESLWRKYKLDVKTGFDEKYLFQSWCFLNRFPVFSELRKEKSPKLIIGAGISYLKDFIMCFGWDQMTCGNIQYGDVEPRSEGNKSKKRRYYWVKLDDYTTLVVVPFFSGPYGLNSDYLLHAMGQRIGELINE